MKKMTKATPAKKVMAKKPMMKKGGAVAKPLAKAQTGTTVGKKTYTPFQNYMKQNPSAVASDTTYTNKNESPTNVSQQVSRFKGNDKLEKAYQETYYGDQGFKRRTKGDEVKYNSEGKRVRKTGGSTSPKMKKGGMVKMKKK
jgi:hypothetical protein